MEEKEEKYRLYIPRGISVQKEFWRGFGYPELARAFIVFGALIVIPVIWSIIVGSTSVLMLGMMIVMGVSISITQKDNTNLSVWDMVETQRKFMKSKKQYYYVLKDEYDWR